MNLNLLHIERSISAFESHHVRSLKTPSRLIEEVDVLPPPPPLVPKSAVRIHVSVRNMPLSPQLPLSSVAPGTSPRMSADKRRVVRPVMRVPPLQSGSRCVAEVTPTPPRVHALTQPVTPAILRQLVNARMAPIPPTLRDTNKAIQSDFHKVRLYSLALNLYLSFLPSN